jgi:hypothetical protein
VDACTGLSWREGVRSRAARIASWACVDVDRGPRSPLGRLNLFTCELVEQAWAPHVRRRRFAIQASFLSSLVFELAGRGPYLRDRFAWLL